MQSESLSDQSFRVKIIYNRYNNLIIVLIFDLYHLSYIIEDLLNNFEFILVFIYLSVRVKISLFYYKTYRLLPKLVFVGKFVTR